MRIHMHRSLGFTSVLSLPKSRLGSYQLLGSSIMILGEKKNVFPKLDSGI